jgi:hypothetical protein
MKYIGCQTVTYLSEELIASGTLKMEDNIRHRRKAFLLNFLLDFPARKYKACHRVSARIMHKI